MSEEAKNEKKELVEEPLVQRDSAIEFQGKKLNYKTTTGRLPLRDKKGNIEGQIFFVYYEKVAKESNKKRPLTFAFNGGPGSPAIWLHLGALGPKRVQMTEDGFFPKPPFELIDNENTWLDETDLVFVDPISCGYSEAKGPEEEKKFCSVQGDLDSMGEFIHTFLQRFQRWHSPLFLAGESYGGLRVAGLAETLFSRGVTFNGVILISAALNFYTLHTGVSYKLHDLPYSLILPSYTATAWYHEQLPEESQGKELEVLLKEVEQWAEGDYSLFLMKGNRATTQEEQAIVEKLVSYTGLSTSFIREKHYRIDLSDFCFELFHQDNKVVGRLDTRFVGGKTSETVLSSLTSDPSLAGIIPPFNTCFYQYIQEELGYESKQTYQNLTGLSCWEWGSTAEGATDTSQSLRKAMTWNPYLKVYVGCGYYDLGTPYFAMDYTLSHMQLTTEQQENVSCHYYPSGHMYYIHEPSLVRFQKDIANFIESSI